ncbi:MAG: AAA family ATPase [Balneolaceae bacterium]
MEELISYQNNLLHQVESRWRRYLYPELTGERRLLGLKGLRGVGKTTMFLQYLAFDYAERQKGLYVTADHPWFYNHTLFDLAADWYKYGGQLLLIDEVHKYPGWSRELKLIYDGHPDLKVMFTSSSALDLYRGESDLSRRLVTRTLHGLSFREYLELKHGYSFRKLSLDEILKHHSGITPEITKEIKILPLFGQYLQEGYFPFSGDADDEPLFPRLLRIINTVLESDLAAIEGYDAGHIEKIKKLLGVVAESAPFEPNISKIAGRLQLGRNTVNFYLKNLHDACILHLLNKPGKGITKHQKPSKIYFENPVFTYAFQGSPNIGTVRETFFLNQLHNAGHRLHLSPDKGDFLVNARYLFEVGGKNKDDSQIRNMQEAYLALDNIEHGFANTVPLWLFGFLY